MDAARRFWTDVMGFELVEEQEAFCFVLDREARLAVFLTDHAGAVADEFNEQNVGLDHLALAVPDEETLLSWQQRLAHLGVEHSDVTESDGGHHLNLRAPDNLAIELFVISPVFAASLGLIRTEAFAGTH
jgi:catechol 2,3-dioxygenase-like lactoylglutathione lyase family enzyme